MSQVDSYLFKLSLATIGMILRGSEYNEEAQNMDKDQNMAKAEQASDCQTEAHND